MPALSQGLDFSSLTNDHTSTDVGAQNVTLCQGKTKSELRRIYKRKLVQKILIGATSANNSEIVDRCRERAGAWYGGFSNPQPNPQEMMSCMAYGYFGSPRGFVCRCKTYSRSAVTAEVASSSLVVPAISRVTSRMRSTGQALATCLGCRGRIAGIATLHTDNPSKSASSRMVVVRLSLLPVLCACPPR